MPNIQTEQSTPSTVKLTITVAPAEYDKYLRSQALELGEKINIPGFRPGKAPYDVIKNQVGEMKLLSEALNEIVAETYRQAILEQKLRPAMPPKIDVTKVAPGNPIEYQAEIITIPTVTLPDLTKIKIKKQAVKVTDAEVAEALNELRKMRAKEALKSDGAVIGDKIEFDLKSVVSDDSAPGEEVKNQTMILGETELVEGFKENLLGMKSGEEKTFTVKFPDKYHQPRYAGKDVAITVKIKAVWQIDLPELGDEFARAVNQQFPTLEELKKQLAENIQLEKTQTEEERAERIMIEELIKQSTFSQIAPPLQTDMLDKIMADMRENIERGAGQWEAYLQSIKKTEADLRAEFAPEADRRIKVDALIAEVMETQKIEVDDSKVREELNRFLAQFPSVEVARQRIDLERLKTNLRSHLLVQEVFAWLKRQVKFE